MADTKISALTSATTPLAGTEVLPIVQSSTTKKVSVSDLTAGRVITCSGAIIEANSAGNALRITQTGAGNALVVEDSASPDATPFVVTAVGDVGVGTTPSAWSGLAGFQVGSSAAVSSSTLAGTVLSDNAYATSAGWACKYIATGAASIYEQYAGSHYWYTAASGTAGTAITLKEVLTIDQASSNLKLSAGNLVQGTAAKGVNFTANTPAAGMTSQLLNWYEEGTWTPTQGAALTVVGTFSSSGKYTRIGRLLTVVGALNGSTSISSATGIICGGLPYAPTDTGSGSAAMSSINAGSTLYIPNTNIYAVTAMSGGGGTIIFTATFFV